MEVQLPYRTGQQSTAKNISSAADAGAGPDDRGQAPGAEGEGLGNRQDDQSADTGEGREESATARVRRILIQPLAQLARPRGVSAGQHADNLDRLARKLRHMDEAGLRGLLELCLGHQGRIAVAKGGAVPVCPLDGVILAWAYALQAPPVNVSDYPASVLRSAMGRRAADMGFGVELLRMARRHGPPPGAYSLTQLREEAEDNRRRRAVLREEADAGNRLPPNRAAWLQAWHDDALIVERLIAEGDERREAKSGEAA